MAARFTWGIYYADSDWADKNTLEIPKDTLTNTPVSIVHALS